MTNEKLVYCQKLVWAWINIFDEYVYFLKTQLFTNFWEGNPLIIDEFPWQCSNDVELWCLFWF